MNIFALDVDAKIAAQMHCDKHVVKMILEYAQLLSTAHRMLDGKDKTFTTPEGKQQTLFMLPGERACLITKMEATNSTQKTEFKLKPNPFKYVIENPVCYGATHKNHPSAVWARESTGNYNWLFQLFQETSTEYTYRYGKIHQTYAKLGNFLSRVPYNLSEGRKTLFPQAMPEEYKNEDSITAYQNYYVGSKSAIAKWTKREVPTWFSDNYKDYDASNFAR